MLIRKAYKFRLDTPAAIKPLFFQYAGNCRFLWNKALAMNLHRLENSKPILWYDELNWFAQLWKESDECEFLKLSPSQTLQQTLRNMQKAFRAAFDKKQPLKRMPVFKKKGGYDSFSFPQGFKIEGRRISLPKIGWLNFRKSRIIQGTPKNVTVSRQGEHWYIAIQVEMVIAEPVHPSTSMAGFDMGVKRLITGSDGRYTNPIDTDRQFKRIKVLQRRLAKKVKFSNNWKKIKKQINKLHTKIANIRRNILHQLTTTLSKSHAMIVLENLQIRNMTKSAKGTLDNPGKMVKQKSGLNRVILNQGWGLFRELLEYKQQWNGGSVLYVNPKNTSLRCPVCTHTEEANRVSQAKFHCQNCGHESHADENAAINILERGHRLLACGQTGLPA